MRPKLLSMILSAFLLGALVASSSIEAADGAPKEKITYSDHVAPVFRARCGTCHNPDKAKRGLNLDSFSAAMRGVGSVKVIEPGDAKGSSILGVISHKEEPNSPPIASKI